MSESKERVREQYKKDPQKSLDRRKRYRVVKSLKAMLFDARNSDQKRGWSCDLTEEVIEEKISEGCVYCGEIQMRMTLDRINNDEAYNEHNVVGACIRCNYMRRDMPFAAWKRLVPVIRKLREEGEFGDWTGAPQKAACEVRGHCHGDGTLS